MAASKEGHLKCVQALIEAGADVNYVDKDGDTALMAAASEGHTEIVKLLVEKGANVNQEREV